jgi:hypothetical protein
MPGFDGTGPLGQGPFTGGGRGYCALRLPGPGLGGMVTGYIGIQGTPVSLPALPVGRATTLPYYRPLYRVGRGGGRGRWRGRWRCWW